MSGNEATNLVGSTDGGLVSTVERERVRYETIVETVGDAVYHIDLDGNFVQVNDYVVKTTGYSRDELVGSPASILLEEADFEKCTSVIKELLTNDDKEIGVVEIDVQTADGGTIPAEARLSLLRSDDEVFGTVGIVRDISNRKQREQQLANQRNTLERLDRINTVIRDINRTLVNASTRSEIERTVCDHLAAFDPYGAAWITAPTPASGESTHRACAGITTDTLPEAGTGDEGLTPAETAALQTGEVEVIHDITSATDHPTAEWAINLGYQSRATVPVIYEGSTYGVLNIYASCPTAFDNREAAVLGELGETIGLAINALERKQALITDQVIELGFRSEPLAEPFADATGGSTGTIRVDRYVPLDHDAALVYYTITDLSPDQFLNVIQQYDGVSDGRIIGSAGTGFRAEVRVDGDTLVSVFATYGGRVKRVTIKDGVCVISAELPFGIDVRRVVDAVQAVYPSIELVSKTTVNRQDTSPQGLHAAVEEQLSDRQYEALEAAYHAGFFKWPRDSTGEDLADSLDISAPTFHEHLRAAQRKLVETLFGDAPAPGF